MCGRARGWAWRLAALCALVLLSAGAAAAGAAPRDVRVGVYENPPKVFTDAHGAPAGIFVDLLKRIAQDEHWRLTYTHCEWRACLDALADGRIDLMPDVAYSAERAKRFDFHKVAALQAWSQVYMRRGLEIRSILDLAGKRVAVLDDSVQQAYLKETVEAFGLKVTFVPTHDLPGTFAAVAGGRADVAVANQYFGWVNAERFGLVESPLVFQPAPLYYATQRGRNADLLAAIDRHLSAWRDAPDGPYDEIVNAWRPHARPIGLARYGLPVAGTLAVALVMMAAAAFVLRRRLAGTTHDAAVAEARRAEAEEEREEAERQFRATFEQAVVGMAIVSPEGVWLRVNDRLCEIVGHERRELLGRRTADITHPDDHAADRERFRRVLAGEQAVDQKEKRYIRNDGSIVWVAVTAGLARRPDGRPAYFVGVIEDIELRRHTEAALAESEARLQLFVEHAPAALAMFDRDMRCLCASRRWRDEFGAGGLGDDAPSGRPAAWPEAHHRALDGEVCAADEDRVDLPDGSARWLRWEVRPWERPDGTRGGVLVFSEDVTQRRRAAQALVRYRDQLEAEVRARTEELNHAREAAEAASVAKGAFLANMSHEIRTPLNAMIGMVAVMRREALAPRQLEHLRVIEGASQHLLTLINDVLDFSKIEADKLVLEAGDVDVGALLTRTASMLGPEAAARRLRLVAEPAPVGLGVLAGDPMRVLQCLLNLASNAIKFTERGSVTLRTRVESEDEGGVLLRFEVVDTGIGIAEDALRRLFAPFEQADNSTTRRFGGTGLGLAITRHLAGLMGGQAGATSQPGAGSVFWFSARLGRRSPATGVAGGRADAAPGPVDASAPAGADAGSPGPSSVPALEAALRARHAGRRVLLVEDNEVNRLVAQLLLGQTGLVVDAAFDGTEALERLDAARYDLVLMDMHMPRMDGLDATRLIRARPDAAAVPVLAMTANVFAEDQAACRAAGMNGFIGKPYTADDMLAKVLEWLDTGVAGAGGTARVAALPADGMG